MLQQNYSLQAELLTLALIALLPKPPEMKNNSLVYEIQNLKV
jgi:hypothetical protein